MVRMEKVLYEQALNGLSRAKSIGAPRKWFYANPYDHLRRRYTDIQSTTIVSSKPPFLVESWLLSLNGSINLK